MATIYKHYYVKAHVVARIITEPVAVESSLGKVGGEARAVNSSNSCDKKIGS